MIVVTVSPRPGGPVRDRAEAATPEDAVLAARTLLMDARDAGCGEPVCSLLVDATPVALNLTWRQLNAALIS